MFSDNQIELCYPHKNENVVNIIIGANGTGKTKLLEFLYNYLITGCLPSEQLVKGNNPSSISVIDWKGNQLNTANEIYGQFSKQLFHKEKALSGKDERIYFVRSQLLHNTTNNIANNAIQKLVVNRVVDINEQFTSLSLKLISKAVLEKERNIEEAKAEVRKQKAIKWFNEFFTATKIKSRLLRIEPLTEEPIFTDFTNSKEFYFSKLSSGEKQLYIKIASLILMEPHDSLILIDEPELSLHPEWQASFIAMLKKIGSNNQFIVATHSPYIVSNLTPEDHLIVLGFNEGKIQINYDPRFIERDINTTLNVMGYSHPLPDKVSELRKQYRQFFDNRQEETPEAVKVKNELLQYETLDSSFFSELEFMKVLRDETH